MELVLYYSTGDARMKKQEMMMKSVLVRMGVKIRNVAPDQVPCSYTHLRSLKVQNVQFRAHKYRDTTDHAYNTLYEMAQAAADKGLAVYGCSEHAPSMPCLLYTSRCV